MNRRWTIVICALILMLGLGVAVPTTYSFVLHLKAKSLAIQGCESWWSESEKGLAPSLFSEAAQLDPAYIPLASAGKTLQVDRMTAERFGYEQQWLDGLHVFQGFCESTINPRQVKK